MRESPLYFSCARQPRSSSQGSLGSVRSASRGIANPDAGANGAELPPAFEALRASGAPIIHYKMCSTFDSSPTTGSVGRAIELGRKVFGEQPTPLVVGAPVLGRYVVFGNLFARSGLDTEPYRLDRHPTMSRHPVTPMTESDLRRVLAAQTALPVELVDVLQLEQLGDRGWTVAPGMPAPVILFDTLREAHLPVIGRVIEDLARNGPLFVVGSSGISMRWSLTGDARRPMRPRTHAASRTWISWFASQGAARR